MKPTIIEVFSKKRLGQRSFTKYIKYICPDCKRTRSVPKYDFKNRKTNYCFNCFGKNNRRSLYNNFFMKYKKNVLSLSQYELILRSISINKTNGVVYCGQKNMTSEDAAKLLAPLGIVDPKNILTADLKELVLNKILSDKLILFNLVSKMVKEKHHIIYTNSIVMNCTTSWFLKMLDKLEIKYKLIKNKSLTITYGSFFINNKWVHIG
jgi:hypothetical protein